MKLEDKFLETDLKRKKQEIDETEQYKRLTQELAKPLTEQEKELSRLTHEKLAERRKKLRELSQAKKTLETQANKNLRDIQAAKKDLSAQQKEIPAHEKDLKKQIAEQKKEIQAHEKDLKNQVIEQQKKIKTQENDLKNQISEQQKDLKTPIPCDLKVQKILQMRAAYQGHNFAERLFLEGFEKLEAALAKGSDQIESTISRALEKLDTPSLPKVTMPTDKTDLTHPTPENPYLTEAPLLNPLQSLLSPSDSSIESAEPPAGKKKDGPLILSESPTPLPSPLLLNSLETPHLSQEAKESEASPEKPLALQFRKLLQDYQTQTQKKANHGLQFTDKFENWIKKNPKISENEKSLLLEYSNSYSKLIKRTVEGFLLFSDKTLKEIRAYLNQEMKFSISPDALVSFSKKFLSDEGYQKRFIPFKLPEGVISKIKNKIRFSELSQKQIAKELSTETHRKIGANLVNYYAQKILSATEYEERFEGQTRIPQKIKDRIIDKLHNTTLSQSQIAVEITNELTKLDLGSELVGISANAVRRIALREFSKQDYEKRFLGQKKYDEATLAAICDDFRNTTLSQKEIARNCKVPRDLVRYYAEKEYSPSEYQIRFPSNADKYDETQVNEVKKALRNPELSAHQIADQVGVSCDKVLSVAKTEYSPEDYEQRITSNRFKYTQVHIATIQDALKDPYILLGEIADQVKRETGADMPLMTVRWYVQKLLPPIEYKNRFPLDFPREVGYVTHVFLEKLFCESMNHKGINAWSEVTLNDEKRRIDNLIHLNERAREFFSNQFPPSIKFLAIDYSLDTSQINFEEKCNKNYQSEDTLFIFVPIYKNKETTDFVIPDVKCKDNINIISIEDFPNFFKFSSVNRELFKKFIGKVRAIERTKDRRALDELSELVNNIFLLKNGQNQITSY